MKFSLYCLRFWNESHTKKCDSLPVVSPNLDALHATVESSPNVPRGTTYDVILLGEYDSIRHHIRSLSKARKVSTHVKSSSLHSKAAEAATPERKEKRLAKRSEA